METVELDGKNYVISLELVVNGSKYLHLANIENPEDFCIRKVEMENGEEYLVGLESREEFNTVLEAFADKHREDLEI